MSRYIDYDALDYKNWHMIGKSSDFIDGVVYMAERIEEAPSIDIVRCKECKHRIHTPAAPNKNRPCEIHSELNNCGLRKGLKPRIKLDDFCSYGERREP